MGLTGMIKGLGITLKHFIETYSVDIKEGKQKFSKVDRINARKTTDTKGTFTIQYPEEKNPVPEAFRYVPFLVYDETDTGEKDIRCTSCGICAKVCPPQCIWITRSVNPETGKPVPKPAKFFIDIDICMNCGLCAEFCPFEAIRMDHDYEISSFDRFNDHIYDLEKLLKASRILCENQTSSVCGRRNSQIRKRSKKGSRKSC